MSSVQSRYKNHLVPFSFDTSYSKTKCKNHKKRTSVFSNSDENFEFSIDGQAFIIMVLKKCQNTRSSLLKYAYIFQNYSTFLY